MPYPFKLPELGYSTDALEPHIDARTMEIHHGKHHAAYTNNLNAALENHPDLHGREAEELLRDLASLPEEIRTAVRNNGGGFVNHDLFWKVMAPGGADRPTGDVASAIDSAFGSFDQFRDTFSKTAAGRFGSGWAWLVIGSGGRLEVVSTPNQDTPVMEGRTPILGLDVWEHAYYLHYQNRRPDYIQAWWNVVNWDEVARMYDRARGRAAHRCAAQAGRFHGPARTGRNAARHEFEIRKRLTVRRALRKLAPRAGFRPSGPSHGQRT